MLADFVLQFLERTVDAVVDHVSIGKNVQRDRFGRWLFRRLSQLTDRQFNALVLIRCRKIEHQRKKHNEKEHHINHRCHVQLNAF